jgi:hypothetical protein
VEQLLCVLPAESVDALPAAARHLMTSPQSPIYDMFHCAIETDRRNDRAWLWIQLLPFVDVNRIIAAVGECEESFTDTEKARNSKGTALLYVHHTQVDADGSDSFVVAGCTEKQDKIFGYVSALHAAGDVAAETLPAPPTGDASSSWQEKLKCFEYSLPPEAEHRSELVEGLGEVKFIRRFGGSGGKRRGKGKKRGGRGSKGQRGGGGRKTAAAAAEEEEEEVGDDAGEGEVGDDEDGVEGSEVEVGDEEGEGSAEDEVEGK